MCWIMLRIFPKLIFRDEDTYFRRWKSDDIRQQMMLLNFLLFYAEFSTNGGWMAGFTFAEIKCELKREWWWLMSRYRCNLRGCSRMATSARWPVMLISKEYSCKYLYCLNNIRRTALTRYR